MAKRAYRNPDHIRRRNMSAPESSGLKRLTGYLSDHSNMEHYRGKLLIVEVYRIRIRE